MKRLSVDRIEGGTAVCENSETGEIENISVTQLPKGIREGDVLNYENGTYLFDAEETRTRKERIKRLQDSIFDE